MHKHLLQRYCTLFSVFFFAVLPSFVFSAAAEPTSPDDDLLNLDIQDLMDLSIFSASKTSQPLSKSPAAAFVITNEDIRRSGATTISDVLRMVPGLQVAQIDAHDWAVTSRGFNWRFANKLLVLIDGRTVYSSVYSGVYWDAVDIMLEDVDRIEVIRGPGASLWGANAVNGVINILTKNSKDTQGTLVTAGSGSTEPVFGSVRYGGTMQERGHYRVYAKHHSWNDNGFCMNEDTDTGWQTLQGGFRMDYQSFNGEDFTLQGDIYQNNAENGEPEGTSQTCDLDTDMTGGNILGRWTHSFSAQSEGTLQMYYSHFERTEDNQDDQLVDDTTFGIREDTLDLELQHRFNLGNIQDILWGAGCRYIQDRAENQFSSTLEPDRKSSSIASCFLQDTITLKADILTLTLGSKIEHYTNYGTEIQPSARLMWTPDDRNSFWAAFSRAARTPSWTEQSVHFTIVLSDRCPSISILGNDDIAPEELLAYEVGYRTVVTQKLAFDCALFYNEYHHLINVTSSTASSSGEINFVFDNVMDAETYGAEISSDWKPLSWITLKAAYSWMDICLHPDISIIGANNSANAKSNPTHQVSLRSMFDLPHATQADIWIHYVDSIEALGVEAYLTADIRLAWKPRKNIELSLVGRNLLESKHLEFLQDEIVPTEITPSVYGKITWSF